VHFVQGALSFETLSGKHTSHEPIAQCTCKYTGPPCITVFKRHQLASCIELVDIALSGKLHMNISQSGLVHQHNISLFLYKTGLLTGVA